MQVQQQRSNLFFFPELFLSFLIIQFYFSKKDELVPVIKLEMSHTWRDAGNYKKV